jgi:DnaJ-class molecular chaperone
MRPRRDLYAALGVPREAEREAIGRAFRSLAAEHHPDISRDPDALERFREIVEAYDVLSRDDARERYDRYGFEPGRLGGGSRSARELFDALVERERLGGSEADVPLDRGESEAQFPEAAVEAAGGGAGPGSHPVTHRVAASPESRGVQLAAAVGAAIAALLLVLLLVVYLVS